MSRRATVSALRAKVPATKRVAIYCRQSVEDKTSEFGSLDAQSEAIERFVRGHGGEYVITRYTDAGYSGRSTDRPDFQRLLADVRAGKLDEVVTYKIDRLSRSIVDFVGLMELFEKHGVTFRSATQPFSTGDSMGRFSLNMLAMFAQFEREMIAERTRDKIHATRRRGAWTGGAIPLGYDVKDKRLVVNDAEAERVRSIFSIFLAEDSIIATLDVLRERGWRTKSWVTRTGIETGGLPFTKDSLRALLSNPVYVGKVRLGDEINPGAHPAIVPDEAFGAAQRALGAAHGRATMRNKRSLDAMLRGLLVCARCGAAMTPTFASKRGRRIPYYTCNTIAKQGAKACPGSRVAAIVHRKAAWIVDRLRWFEDLLPPQTPREFVSGETFLYLGRQHRLRVERVHGLRHAAVAMEGGRLVVRVPAEVPDAGRLTLVRTALREWYRRRAAHYLPPRLERWAMKLGCPVPRLLVREPPKRWGSCDAAGNVRINWRTIQVAPRLIDYVLAHELVHLEHSRHDADFWSRLGEVMNDADARRSSLRRAGTNVNW